MHDELEYQNRKVTSTFQYIVFQTYKEAENFAKNELGWQEDQILIRKGKIHMMLESGEIIGAKLDCIVADTGSEDYIFYFN